MKMQFLHIVLCGINNLPSMKHKFNDIRSELTDKITHTHTHIYTREKNIYIYIYKKYKYLIYHRLKTGVVKLQNKNSTIEITKIHFFPKRKYNKESVNQGC